MNYKILTTLALLSAASGSLYAVKDTPAAPSTGMLLEDVDTASKKLSSAERKIAAETDDTTIADAVENAADTKAAATVALENKIKVKKERKKELGTQNAKDKEKISKLEAQAAPIQAALEMINAGLDDGTYPARTLKEWIF